MGKHFPEGSPVRVDIETAMEGIPIVRLRAHVGVIFDLQPATPADGDQRRALILVL